MRVSSLQAVLRLSKHDFRQGIVRLLDETIDTLFVIWSEAGYEDNECQMLLGDISTKFKITCENELSAERQILEHARHQVQDKIKQ